MFSPVAILRKKLKKSRDAKVVLQIRRGEKEEEKGKGRGTGIRAAKVPGKVD